MEDRTTFGGFLGSMLGTIAGALVGGITGGIWVDASIFPRFVVVLVGVVLGAAVGWLIGMFVGCLIGGILDLGETALGEAKFRALWDRALTELHKRNWDQAVLSLTEVIRQRPWLIEAYHRRAIAYLALHELGPCIADCSCVIRSDPTPITRDQPVPPFVADAYVHRGAALAELRQHDKAIADFTNAIQLTPDVPTPYQMRAQSYRAMGDAKRAAEDEAKARDLANVVS